MKFKITYLLSFIYSVIYSQTNDWKAILLSKEIWYAKEMYFGKDTFIVAAERDMTFELLDNQIKDENGLLVYSTDEWEFKGDTFFVNHVLSCGEALYYNQMTYKIQNDSLLSRQLITYESKRQRDIIVERSDSPFDFQFLKYENGMVFLRRIEE